MGMEMGYHEKPGYAVDRRCKRGIEDQVEGRKLHTAPDQCILFIRASVSAAILG